MNTTGENFPKIPSFMKINQVASSHVNLPSARATAH